MKYSVVYIIALAGLSSAAPTPQFDLPFSLPSLPLPSLGFPGIGGGSRPSAAPTAVPTTKASEAQPQPTGSPARNVRADCTPQGQNGGSTENGVKDKNCCADLTVVFARGTSEMGNVGTIAGPPMFKSLRTKLGANRVLVQGVDYPADIAGNANLGASGGPAMAQSVKDALAQCPNTKVVLSGYSQGGMVAHNAFSAQGLTASQVSGAVLFGDPFNGQAVGDLAQDKIKQFCASGDAICAGGDIGGGFGGLSGLGARQIGGGHLSYGSNADEAADFVIGAAGL